MDGLALSEAALAETKALPPRLFVPAADVPPGCERVRLTGDAYRHIARVLRLAKGDELVLFDGAGTEIKAEITESGEGFVAVALGPRVQRPAAPCSITLLVAVAKGERMDWIVQKTTELGVGCIIPVLSERVVVRLNDAAGEAKRRRWQTIAQEAARQCRRADVPALHGPLPLQAALAQAGGNKLLLWEDAHGVSLRQAVDARDREVTLLVGPEGGFSPREAGDAIASGFADVSLGPRILRAETAAMVAVALVQAATGGLG